MSLLQWSFLLSILSSVVILTVLLGFTKTGAVLGIMILPVTVIWATVTGQYGFYIGVALSGLVYGLALLQLGKESK